MAFLEEMKEFGYTKIHTSSVSTPTIELAKELGKIIEIQDKPIVDLLRVNSISSLRKNTYGGNFGCNELPLHTDLAHWSVPPRYLLLRCIIPGINVSTRLLHHSNFIRDFHPTSINRALFKPRRILEGRKFMLRLKNNGIFRWDSLFLKPENADAVRIVDQSIQRNHNEYIEEVYLSTPGDFIVIDNWNALHGRSIVPDAAMNRLIHRVYLSEILN